MMAASILDLRRGMTGSKRLSDTGGMTQGVIKRSRTTGKAASAFKSLLGFLHITDRKKNANEGPSSAPTTDNDDIKPMPPLRSGETEQSLSAQRKIKAGLSKSWSYFVHDPFDELSDPEQEYIEADDNVFFNDSYFEDDYCTDYHDRTDEELVSVKSPHLRGIKMGTSSLKFVRDRKQVPSYGVFRRDAPLRKACRKLHVSLPDVSSGVGFMAASPGKHEPSTSCSESSEDRKESADEVSLHHLFCLNTGLGMVPLDEANNAVDGKQVVDNLSFLAKDETLARAGQLIQADKSDQALLDSLTENESSSNVSETSMPKSQDKARYRNKRPSPLNLTSTPDRNKRVKDSVISKLVFIDCLTTDSNEMSRSEESDSSDVEMVPINRTGQSTSEHSKMDISSFPTSDDDQEVTTVDKNILEYPSATKRNSSQRRSLESGYDSTGKTPSTAGTSPEHDTPGTMTDHRTPELPSQTPGERKQSISLSSLGSVTSPQVLNKLDGLLSPPRSVRRCLSPRFKFSKAISSTELNIVPETIETSLNQSFKASVAVQTPKATQTEQEGKNVPFLERNKIAVEDKLKTSKPEIPHQLVADTKPRSLRDILHETHVSHTTASVSPADDNGNYLSTACQSPLPDPGTTNRPTLTPANKIPTPISTSSPLQNPRKSSGVGGQMSELATDLVSPVRQAYATPRQIPARFGNSSSRKKRRKRLREQSRQSARLPFRDFNNNSLATNRSDDEIEVISPSSRDYLLLKRSADFIINRLPRKKDIKPYLNVARLVEFLNNFYLKEMSKLCNKNVQSISDFKNLKTEFCDIFRVDRLAVDTCIGELLVAVLVHRPLVVAACADYAFENLHYLVKCPEFLKVAPEFLVFLLSNDHRVVLGPRGFPLAHAESEREVHRAVSIYLRANRSSTLQHDRHLKSLLMSVADPFTKTKLETHQRYPERLKPSTKNEIPSVCNRPYHEIEYCRSETLVTTPDTRQEYLFQPFLSSGSSRYLPSEEVVASPDDVMNLCNSAHTLRKLYFSYRRHNQVPYITQIGLQYACHGRKKLYTLGDSKTSAAFSPVNSEKPVHFSNRKTELNCPPGESPGQLSPEKENSSPSSITVPAASDVSILDNSTSSPAPEPRTKMTAMKLESGEHVTGVSLLGDAVLHNVEITTNKGRQVRAHPLPDCPVTSLWTPIPPPTDKSPYCLQALYADVRTPSSRTYLRDIGAIWAVMSLPLNNLST